MAYVVVIMVAVVDRDTTLGEPVGGISLLGRTGHSDNTLDRQRYKQIEHITGLHLAVYTQEVGNNASNMRGSHGGPGQ